MKFYYLVWDEAENSEEQVDVSEVFAREKPIDSGWIGSEGEELIQEAYRDYYENHEGHEHGIDETEVPFAIYDMEGKRIYTGYGYAVSGVDYISKLADFNQEQEGDKVL